MYECYNEAYAYLKTKYGYTRKGLTCSASKKLHNKNQKQRLEIEKTLTDRDYNLVLNVSEDNVQDHTDKAVLLLMKQYPLGICVKQELHSILVYLNVLKPLEVC